MIKNYLKCYLYLISQIVIWTLILSIINYFVKLPVSIIKIVIPVISFFISTIILGKWSKEKAYIEGVKFSTIYLVFITIIKLILKTGFNYKVMIIYLTIILSSMIGAMLGINLKNKA